MSSRAHNPTSVKQVAGYYAENGWTVIVTPADSGVSLITAKGSRLHFVRVTATTEAVYSAGIARNEYVQNAFSNAATPVFAVEVPGAPPKYRFINPNTDTRVAIREKAPAKGRNPPTKK